MLLGLLDGVVDKDNGEFSLCRFSEVDGWFDDIADVDGILPIPCDISQSLQLLHGQEYSIQTVEFHKTVIDASFSV